MATCNQCGGTGGLEYVCQACKGTGDVFTLANDPPCYPRWTAENFPTTQRVLFSGMDCEPGQLDLFKTDGEIE